MASRFRTNKRSRFLVDSRVLFLLTFVILTTGCETKTNTITTNAFLQDLAVSPNSRSVIVWTDNNQTTSFNNGGECMNFHCRLYARAYDQTGTPVTGQILVSPTINGLYTSIEAAINDTGFFVLVYDRYIYNQSNSSLSNQLFFQRYSSSGAPLGSAQFIDYGHLPDVVMTANGDFYITYSNFPGFLNPNQNVYAKKYNSSGLQTLPRILVDTATHSSSTVRALCTGEFIVAYRAGPTNLSSSTYIQRYHANGTPNGAKILVTTTNNTPYIDIGETVIYKPNGDFAIASSQPGTSSGTLDYYIWRYDTNGNPSAQPEFLFNHNTTVNHTVFTMSGNTCGHYALIDIPDGSNDVTVREYSSDDTPVPPYTVNQASPNRMPLIGLASLSYVAVWDRPKGTVVPYYYPIDTIHVRRPLFAAFLQKSSSSSTRVCYQSCNDCPKTRVIGKPATPGYAYSWSPTTYLNNANQAQPTVTHPGGSAPLSITYTVTISGACCQRTETVTVNFVPKCPT
jgi:hypothetical protein